jgi:fructoselysine-6-P-deglycase FrlB-like protein
MPRAKKKQKVEDKSEEQKKSEEKKQKTKEKSEDDKKIYLVASGDLRLSGLNIITFF